MNEGGEWQNEIWTDLRSEHRIQLLFQGVGAHSCILERRNGITHGIYCRLVADDRFSGWQILPKVQWCVDTLVSSGGYSAYQMVSGSNPADRMGWDDRGADLLFAQDASLSGQLAHQWTLRMTAQEAARKEVANSKLRRLLAHSMSFSCTDVAIGDCVLFYKTVNGKGAPRWGGPAKISEVDETGVTGEFRSQTFQAARH